MSIICIIIIGYGLISCFGKTINYELDMGGIPFDQSLDIVVKNRDLFNSANDLLSSGDTLVIPNKTFYLMGGIKLKSLNSINFNLMGTIIFSDKLNKWPMKNNKPDDCIYFENCHNISFFSSNSGIINGNGDKWWGLPFVGILIHLENRPKLFHMKSVSNISIENLNFINSPYWTVHIENVNQLIIKHSSIINKRTNMSRHTLIDKSAFNTDGFDIQGENVHIHDCYIWTQDDCIAVKGNSKNMLFERITASGVGLTIGSIGTETVDNITFRDSYMPNTDKGIYIKFNGAANNSDGGLITNILYENITIVNPSEYAIWIGPAQQADSRFICHANPCSLCWPTFSPWAKCNAPLYGNFSNITLTDIQIIYKDIAWIPHKYIGVLMAPKTNPMKNVRFNNVRSNLKKNYICQGVNGTADANTFPIPDCFL